MAQKSICEGLFLNDNTFCNPSSECKFEVLFSTKKATESLRLSPLLQGGEKKVESKFDNNLTQTPNFSMERHCRSYVLFTSRSKQFTEIVSTISVKHAFEPAINLSGDSGLEGGLNVERGCLHEACA